jgi:N-acetylmuramoyl-L-alanine amidase
MATICKRLVPFLLLVLIAASFPRVGSAAASTLQFTNLSPAPSTTVAPGPVNIGATVQSSANIVSVGLQLSGVGTILTLGSQPSSTVGVYKTVNLGPGSYTITMTAVDNAGGTFTSQWDFTVGSGGESQWFTADGTVKPATFNATMQSLVQAFRYHLFGQSWDGQPHPELTTHVATITTGAPVQAWASPDGGLDSAYTTSTLQSLVEAFRWHLFGISWQAGTNPDMVTHAFDFTGPQPIQPWFDSAGRPNRVNIEATLNSLVQAMRWHFWGYSWDGSVHADIPNHAGPHTVVLDPGHGGADPGASVEIDGQRIEEKDYNLKIAKRAATLLRAEGYNVILTRQTDSAVNTKRLDLNGDGTVNDADDLQARADVANAAHADLFISIHLNSYDDESAGGTLTLYCDDRPFSSQNRRLAVSLQNATIKSLNNAGYASLNRGIVDDSEPGNPWHLAMLGPESSRIPRPTLMPASLLEALFLSNPREAELLKNDSTIDAIARGIDNGVKGYFQTY